MRGVHSVHRGATPFTGVGSLYVKRNAFPLSEIFRAESSCSRSIVGRPIIISYGNAGRTQAVICICSLSLVVSLK